MFSENIPDLPYTKKRTRKIALLKQIGGLKQSRQRSAVDHTHVLCELPVIPWIRECQRPLITQRFLFLLMALP